MLQGSLTSKFNQYLPEERAKMGRYGTENGLSKVDNHVSLLLDGKLPLRLPHSLRCSGYIIFRLRDWIIKFKTRQIKKYSILAKITNFNARRTFPLYGS